MRRVVDDERMMFRVCDLYYNQNLGQQEITKVMDISRPTVSRLLINAREKGIVRIILADFGGRNHFDLERRLEKRFGLQEAIVAEAQVDMVQTKNALGEVAARYLERILKNGCTVGVSMGTTLTHILPHLKADYFRNVTFIPLIGGVGASSTELHSNYLAESFAKALHGESLVLNTPAMVSSKQVKHELMREESIARVFARAEKMDIALSGIGAPDAASTIIATGYFSPDMIADFNKHHICGDICMRFYDQHGNVALYEHNQRVMGIDIESLRGVEKSIGVACGVEKAGAVRGALAGQYINVLITDTACANALLDQKNG